MGAQLVTNNQGAEVKRGYYQQASQGRRAQLVSSASPVSKPAANSRANPTRIGLAHGRGNPHYAAETITNEEKEMGTSTDAIIAFGFDLGAEEDLPESLQALMDEHENEPDDVLAADLGIELPQYHPGCDYTAYEAARNVALAELKIDLIAHCSGEYTMYFLAARGSNKKARRGYPLALEPADMDAEKFRAQSLAAMRAFCERHGIEWQEPKWHIFSMWF